MTDNHVCYDLGAHLAIGAMRTATATDFHKLVEVSGKKPMMLGLTEISTHSTQPRENSKSDSKSLQIDGHSDGDVVIHAICDALLLAFGKPDLGGLIGTDDPKWKDASGRKIFEEVLKECGFRTRETFWTGRTVSATNNQIQSITVQIIASRPKLIDYLPSIKQSIIDNFIEITHIKIPPMVNVSAKTTDHMLGELGSGDGIACIASVFVFDYTKNNQKKTQPVITVREFFAK